jgi:peptidoglycan/LPS O-acetylase OafA/YrhL
MSKFLMVVAIGMDAVSALYVLMIAPIIITGWNNTHFDVTAAAGVTAALGALVGGPVVAIFVRKGRPRLALTLAGVPALGSLATIFWMLTSESL